MAERLPMPVVPGHAAGHALDPTEVIPRPRPLEQSATGAAKVISGEVVGPRHRAQRARRPGPGSAVTVVLSATGAVAGLSLLMPHGGSSDEATDRSHRPPQKSAADDTADPAEEPVAAGAGGLAEAGSARQTSASDRTETSTTAVTATSTGTSSAANTSATSGTGRHARTGGTWETADWQEAVATAAAAQRSAEQGWTGRHRSGSAFDGDSGQGGRSSLGFPGR